MAALVSLFLAAFLAATLVPAQSEAVLLGLIWAGGHPVWGLVLTATAGNVLGSVVNWLLGRYLAQFSDRRWFPVTPARMERTAQWYHRWGYWSLLVSWLPIVGDPLTLVAGVLREPLWRFLIVVTCAKGGRYVLLAAMASGLL